MNINFHAYHGPNLHTPFAAAVAEFEPIFSNQLTLSVIESEWQQLDETQLWSSERPQHAVGFPDLALQIAIRLQHPNDPGHAKVLIKRDAGKVSIFLGFIDYLASLQVLKSAIYFAERIFQSAGGNTSNQQELKPALKLLQKRFSKWLPQSPMICTLIEQASRRSIPIYPVAPNSRIWLFGQGVAGKQYYGAANDQDSYTGMRLQHDKTLSNTLVKRLGYPGVRHAVATNLQEAKSIASKLGYPVVVKPIADGKGNGVSAFIIDDEDLGHAFSKARAVSKDGIIVEEHIAGNDHRLAVFGGKLAWVAVRYPAHVSGDGVSSIAELIAAENRRRKMDPSAAEDGLYPIAVDQDLIRHLGKQGLTLESCPQQDSKINLRSIANIAKGGALADITALVHPDNIEMAETIARSFRMDTMGIDFMTTDIARSWREVRCAVIEVNGTPGIFFDDRAGKILDAGFLSNPQGRIPSVVLVSPPPHYAEWICQLLKEHKLCAGFASETLTLLKGHSRGQSSDALHTRISALLADPACAAIVIETTAEQARDKGLPLDVVDVTVTFEPMSEKLASLFRAHSSRFIDTSNEQIQVADVIVHLTKEYTNG